MEKESKIKGLNIGYAKGARIKPYWQVKVTEAGNVTEVQFLQYRNSRQTIQKLDDDFYYVFGTGEIKPFEKNENRSQNTNSLRKTFRKLRGLLNANFFGNDNELHITLTYAENMTDEKRLYTDFDLFMKRLKYAHPDRDFLYVNVAEPQGRGAWHCHLVIKDLNAEGFRIEHSELRDLWGHGYVFVTKLEGTDNIGAYLTAYLSDVELKEGQEPEQGQEVVTKSVEGKSKKVIKGGRLDKYPPGMNLYRTSRNVARPRERLMTYEQAKREHRLGEPVFSRTISVKDGNFSNMIMYEQYNSKRDKK